MLALQSCRRRSWLLALLMLVASPLAIPNRAAQRGPSQSAFNRAMTFLNAPGRGSEILEWVYPLARYQSFDCTGLESLEQGAFVEHCQIVWTTAGVGHTGMRFVFDETGTLTKTVVGPTDSWIPPFAVTNRFLKTAAQYLLDQNRSRLTDMQLQLAQTAIAAADAKLLMDVTLMFKQSR